MDVIKYETEAQSMKSAGSMVRSKAGSERGATSATASKVSKDLSFISESQFT